MKYLLTIFICLCLIVFNVYDGGIEVGGRVPVINVISSIGTVKIDVSQATKDEPIAFFTISNNTSSFIVTLEFVNGGRFCNDEDTMTPYEMKLTETGIGILGRGITPIINKTFIITNNQYIWKSEEQTTATVDYTLKILASWNKRTLSNKLYQETIITSIQAVE